MQIDLVGRENAVRGRHFNHRGHVIRIDHVKGPLNPFQNNSGVCRVVLTVVRKGLATEAELAEMERDYREGKGKRAG